MLVFAVTLHNIPEGMAVGVVVCGCLVWASGFDYCRRSTGIVARYCHPELSGGGNYFNATACRRYAEVEAFLYGTLSGVVEPLGALLTILASGFFIPLMPYLLSFAAGAMLYVVVEELIPEMSEGKHSNVGTISFAVGFVR